MVHPITTQDGSKSLLSEQFGVEYHSIYGAVEESLHVFICAGLQRLVLNGFSELSILEMGLGTGLNALLTLIEAKRNPGLSIKYHAIEAYPLSTEVIAKLDYTSYLQRAEYQDDFLALHRLDADHLLHIEEFQFSKQHIKFEELETTQNYDIIYYDAFGPGTQPQLWGEEMMKLMYDSLNPGGMLVTYCAKGSFKRALKSQGFRLDPLPGPAQKREMTRAWKV